MKIRGFRIEPGEIEAVLRGHDARRRLRGRGARGRPGDRRLVAYVVGGVEADVAARAPAPGACRSTWCRRRSSRWSALPLTAERQAGPQGAAGAGVRGRRGPVRGAADAGGGRCWRGSGRRCWGWSGWGVHDNFFALGGHSLLAVTLVERMRRRGVRADVRALFTTPTVAELAAGGGRRPSTTSPGPAERRSRPAAAPSRRRCSRWWSSRRRRSTASWPAVPGGAENVQDIYPLAPLQEGILFHHLLTQEGDPYLLPQPFAFESRARLDAYLAALQAVIARHDILRTAVAWEGLSEPVQVVWRHAPLAVEEVELDPAAGDAARQLYARFDPRHHRIDLGRAPLLRACVAAGPCAGSAGCCCCSAPPDERPHRAGGAAGGDRGAPGRARGASCRRRCPFRNYVAQARLGVSRAEHEAFFRELLGDVDEPTAPFGLRDVRGDGLGSGAGAAAGGGGAGRAAAGAGAGAGGERGEPVPPGVGAGAGAGLGPRATWSSGRCSSGACRAARERTGCWGRSSTRCRCASGWRTKARRRACAGRRRSWPSLVRHEHASLALAQQCSGVPAPAPLFSAIFNYRHGGGGAIGGGEGSAAPAGAEHPRAWSGRTTRVDLSVNDLGRRVLAGGAGGGRRWARSGCAR